MQAVQEQNKVSYAEAVQRVGRECGNGSADARAVLGCQFTAPNLQSALPSDMLILKRSHLCLMCWWELRKQLTVQISSG